MRIGTWNLQQRWSPAHAALLERESCDVWLLTEVQRAAAVASLPAAVRSADIPNLRKLKEPRSWSAVFARKGESVSSPHPASALLHVAGWTFCSSVLPWRGSGHQPGLWEGDGHGPRMRFAVQSLVPSLTGRPLVWGGDWNQPFEGEDWSSSKQGRNCVEDACNDLRLHVPTRSLAHRIPGLFSIDHIAVPAPVRAVRQVVAEADGKRLSDHDAYVVDVDLPELAAMPAAS